MLHVILLEVLVGVCLYHASAHIERPSFRAPNLGRDGDALKSRGTEVVFHLFDNEPAVEFFCSQQMNSGSLLTLAIPYSDSADYALKRVRAPMIAIDSTSNPRNAN